MAAGYPVKVDYVTGDVLTATNLNDLAGTVNLYDPTAKGDLFPAISGTSVGLLAVGANNTILTADSAAATGMKWAAAGGGGGGKVLQVVMGTFTAQVNSTSTSFADTGLTVNITPSLNTSKILVLGGVNGCEKNSGATTTSLKLQLMRGSTVIQNMGDRTGYTNTDTRNNVGSVAIGYLDSPATTAATTYKVQSASGLAGQVAAINAASGSDTVVSTIIVLEIGA